MTPGTLIGIGVGPGDPELLTLRGKRILESVAVVACPADSSGAPGMAWRIVSAFLSPRQRVVALDLPFVLDDAAVGVARARAAEMLAVELQAGRDVAFIAEGDVALYSTFGHIAAVVRKRLPAVRIEMVPGVSAVSAAAAALGRGLVDGGQSLAVVPASRAADRIAAALAEHDAVVLLKPAGAWAEIVAGLDRAGRRASAALVERIGTAEQRIVPGEDFDPSRPPPYFSTVVVAGDRNGTAGD